MSRGPILPCKCCVRTRLSICRTQALEENWEEIQAIKINKVVQLYPDRPRSYGTIPVNASKESGWFWVMIFLLHVFIAFMFGYRMGVGHLV